MLVSRTIRLFLDSIGRREEYEFYLKKFQADASRCFAAICPDHLSLEQSGELLSFDLQFLTRLDLFPLLVLCGSHAPAMRENLEAHAALYTFIDPAHLPTALEQARKEACIPVLYDPSADLHDWLPRLVPALTRRVHLLRYRGGLHDLEGRQVVFHRYLQDNPDQLDPRDGPLIELAAECLEREPATHISVCSPLTLLPEIFTVKGSGSLIRKGSAIEHLPNPENDVDATRLIALFAEAFGKPLRDPEQLLNAAPGGQLDLYLEPAYRGAALLEAHPAGRYLSKFAVGAQARGEGLAHDLWEAACGSQPAIFWRSRRDNPVNHWYEKHADGRQRCDAWTVFWRGVKPSHVPDVIEYCIQRPSDFQENT